ncbi:glycoside hydrolase family 3 N-terminal domain-containing protein, partial [Candidatus Margulisiibacteriota bacterium]
SFGNNFVTIEKYAKAFLKAHQKNTILCALKHFPGLGSAKADPHYYLTNITKTWQERELLPYKKLTENNSAQVIMSTHVLHEKIDPKYPASLSQKWLKDILRKQLGFKGVIISDDLQMKAISKKYDLQTTIIQAIDAGNDLLLFANPYKISKDLEKKIKSIIKKAIEDKKLNAAQIDEAYGRINALKRKHLIYKGIE